MRKKIPILILIIISVFILRMETKERGLFLPTKISFYDITVEAPRNMHLRYFDIDHSIKYLYALFTNYNKFIIEYLTRKKESSIELSFSNKRTNDYLDLYFDIQYNQKMFEDKQFFKTKMNQNSHLLKTNYSNTNVCIFSEFIIYRKEDKMPIYTVFIQHKGHYKQITLTSNKLKYFKNFIDYNCKK